MTYSFNYATEQTNTKAHLDVIHLTSQTYRYSTATTGNSSCCHPLEFEQNYEQARHSSYESRT
jgi:hypothetical protein